MNGPKVALVTGSSRGIGRAIALKLAAHGWNVVVNYHHDLQAALETEQLALAEGVLVKVIQADVANKPDRERLLYTSVEHFGQIDLLVNNAGMAPRRRVDLLEVSEDSFDEILDTNLKGPFFLTQAVAKEMLAWIKSGRMTEARIVNIGSISAYTASPERAEYCLSKAGLGMMTALYATRLAEAGIHVFEIRPGIIQTDMTQVVKNKYDRLIEAGLTPIPRWGQPDDVAQAVALIAEGWLPFSTGEVINVDGGFHLRRL